jgi:hypothetical protein
MMRMAIKEMTMILIILMITMMGDCDDNDDDDDDAGPLFPLSSSLPNHPLFTPPNALLCS